MSEERYEAKLDKKDMERLRNGGAVFNMAGGGIIGNTTTNGWGGGIYFHDGANFNMSGGVIEKNCARKSGNNGCGGGISAEGGGA